MTVSIGLGLSEFLFASATGFWRWVDLCEHGGVDSLWQTDRIISRAPILESMTTMAALAGRTRRLKFGMNVVSLAFRDPVLLAKQCATIDVLSDGRLLPAFGIGNPLAPEWKALGFDTATRGKRTDEALEIVRRLWSEESVDFPGTWHKLRGASIAPRPMQRDLPMWIGGSSDAAIRRTARVGTGWIAGAELPAEAGRIAAAIRDATAAAGRTIDDDHYGAGFPFHFGRPDDRTVEHRGTSAVVLAANLKALVAFARTAGGVIEFIPRVGDFVAVGEPLFHLYDGAATIGDRLLRGQVAFGPERTIEQDSTFAFRVIVDVAIKALSKAINDPTTAVLAIDQLHRLLRSVGRRHLHDDALYDEDGQFRLLFPTPNWTDFVELSFREIRLYGAENFQIARRLHAMGENLAENLPVNRQPALRRELDLLDRTLERLHEFPEDLALARQPDLQGLGGASLEQA
jgi:alkanesulfonate monooxygenase SsuD/methylene tetrahydromethanopterin reductase-like flavin-dependent oxidoreductase (luciferase family)